MDVTQTLGGLENFLEQQNFVSKQRSTPSIHGLSFKEIQACCSLSNQNKLSLLFHRVMIFFKTFAWVNDRKIGTYLFYEYLWINSAVLNRIRTQDYSQKENLLVQIDLVKRVFYKIVLPHYKAHTNKSSKQNFLNPSIASMFPIELPMGFAGCNLARMLASRLQNIEQLYRKENPLSTLIQEIKLGHVGVRVHPTDRPHHGPDWSQRLSHNLLLIDFRQEGDNSDEDLQPSTWWTNKTDQEKIDFMCQVPIRLRSVNRLYLYKGKLIPPSPIQIKLSKAKEQ